VSALSALAEMLHRTEKWLPRGSRRKHPLLSPTTCVATLAEAGVAHNIVPGKASAVYNLRFLPWQTARGITAELRGIAQKIAKKRRVKVDVETIAELAPSEVKPDAPVAQALFHAMAEITGKKPFFLGVGGATLCKQLIEAGIPAVAFGPGSEHMAHMADERLEIDELVQYTAVVIAGALRVIG
jgi:succinyl-diaminopimelate desuccinylase